MLEGVAVRLWLWWGALHFLVAAAAAAAGSELRPPCPCRCNAAPLQVNCSDGQFAAVPDGLPEDTKLLNLTRNKIKTLARQQFRALTQLLDLDLSDNTMASVEAEAFLGLKDLVTLSLARNRLKIFPAGAFSGLQSLRSLDISDNEILVFLDSTFRDLSALQCLKAAGNDLVFISHQAFAGLTSLQELHLDACNLTAVPTEAFERLGGLRRFHFHCLALTALPNYSFRPLERLKELLISDSPLLENLSGNSLFGLNLTSLAIRRSRLAAVPYGSLHHLVYLVHLDLSYNPIAYIHGSLLGDLLRLQEFHLVGGSLLVVEVGAFRGLTHFTLLNVSRNLLTTLEAGAFHSVDTLRALGLDNNPLACDCRLLWVVRRRRHLDFGGNPPTCSTSVQLQDWSFLDLSEAEVPGLLTCRRPRILNRKPQDVRVDQGHTVVFYCNADGDPSPSITWLDPQLKPLTPNGRIRALSNGSLEVRYAQPQDSGSYLCLASNAAGNTSLAVNLRVPAFPSPKNTFLSGWVAFPSAAPGVNGTQKLPLDVKTLLIATTIGFLSFFSSVSVCFVFMLFWSKSKGQIKHTATIAYVPRSAVSNNKAGTSNYMETSRYTMKLI
ncbi:leucine-rich repeat and immunoglobulin-like domain-containing nogo receptor-interacting protein 1 [Takifugu rubripes]|uniref:Leucine rich repeat and Ig domain containing 4a n=1 Tax=Takifugu rubripes TaxID=31033 RepID=A0A3B5KB46_TAKRU|nr:leucine-rich repeat and immunoglobulin-like domain-containing nogo receptor-interacting protein 1 [Takifugu rubripes]|eukprot:XP_003968974.1 PREDICTED: leucine-rich repeat and immunoglobulin-like domain-containing nogo receptor-interacting protein 1 [Takifugu rubripes]